jgi:uncharacterized membrane protein
VCWEKGNSNQCKHVLLLSNVLIFLNFLQIAADMFREHAKKLVEENVSSALDIMKSRIPYGTYSSTAKHITRFHYYFIRCRA